MIDKLVQFYISEPVGSAALTFLVLIMVLPWFLCFIDLIFKTSFSCKIFGWHNGNHLIEIYAVSTKARCSKARCSKCGKNVMLDRQGNWFTY